MGIQDRDYYWEKHKEAVKSNNRDSFDSLLGKTPHRYRQKPRTGSGVRFLLYPALMMGVLWYGADTFLKYQASGKHLTLPPIFSPPSPTPTIPVIQAEPDAIQPISGGIVLKADRQGHFRGTVLINNVPMPFLIDTGATKTSIPEKLAYAARLPFGSPIQSNTAGGTVIDRLTQINSLKIGNAIIKGLDANINRYLDEVLIGMNTLKYFHITQNGNTMTLIANSSSPQQIVRSQAPVLPNTIAAEQPMIEPKIKRPTTIKRTVTCDANHVCTTKYSDR